MHAGLPAGEKRPFEVKSQHCGLGLHCGPHRGDRARSLFRTVRYQRGKKARGAKLAMRRRDRRNRAGARRIIEQDVAAAIDLDIDEAGSEPDPVRQCCERDGRESRPGDDLLDQPALDHDRGVAMERRPVEDVVCRDGVSSGCVHRVVVTFRRCRGRSTSLPRRSATGSSIR